MDGTKLHRQMTIDNSCALFGNPRSTPRSLCYRCYLSISWYPSPFGLQLARSILARPISASINLRDDRVIALPINVAVNHLNGLDNLWLLAVNVNRVNAPTESQAVDGQVKSNSKGKAQETIEQEQIRGESLSE